MPYLKHSPGPWIRQTAGRIVSAEASDPADPLDPLLIAIVRTGLPMSTQDELGCTGGNECLIGAAPALLAALRGLVDWYDDDGGSRGINTMARFDAAREAILKATGE